MIAYYWVYMALVTCRKAAHDQMSTGTMLTSSVEPLSFLLQDNLGRPVPERQTILKILLQQEMMELAMVTDSWNSVRCAKFQVTWSDHHTSTNTFYRPDALMQGC